jgi:hypothetical protein
MPLNRNTYPKMICVIICLHENSSCCTNQIIQPCLCLLMFTTFPRLHAGGSQALIQDGRHLDCGPLHSGFLSFNNFYFHSNLCHMELFLVPRLIYFYNNLLSYLKIIKVIYAHCNEPKNAEISKNNVDNFWLPEQI